MALLLAMGLACSDYAYLPDTVEETCEELTWWADDDSDGWGDPERFETGCLQPEGTAGQDGDCDDTDPTISPDATEAWYDGVDQDCDGGSDFDADADGQDATEHGGDDCDDSDPDIYLDAPETFYDGIDQDCGVLDDEDPDHDGWIGEAGGGEDCDDLDPFVHPEAVETCSNGKDDDCDGTDNGCGLDDQSALDDADHMWTGRMAGAALGHVAGVGDLNHDGYADAIVSSTKDGDLYDAGGVAWVLLGPIWDMDSLDEAPARIDGPGEHMNIGHGITSAGDLDGDGYPELWVGREELPTALDPEVMGWLLAGPVLGEQPADTHATYVEDTPLDATDVVFAPVSVSDGRLGYALGLPHDEDGDAGVLLIFEGAPTSGVQVPSNSRRTVGRNVEGERLGTSLASLDADGDSLLDLLVGVPGASGGDGQVLLLLGPLDHDGVVGEPAATILGSGGFGTKVVAAGDINGDGVQDWASYGPDHQGGVITLVEGSTRSWDSTLGTSAQLAQLRPDSADDSWVADFDGLGDFDGDGFDDLVIGTPYAGLGGQATGAVRIVSGPLLGSLSLDDFPTIYGTDAGARAGQHVAGLGDTNGDGLGDLLLSAPALEVTLSGETGLPAEDVGRAYLWLGQGL